MRAGSVVKHSEKRVVGVSRAALFDAVANVEQYQSFLPWCTSSRIVHRFSPLKFDGELTVKFGLIYQASYISRVQLEPHTRVTVALHPSPILETLTNEWRFFDVPDESGKTRVHFDVEFQFRSHMYAAAAKLFFNDVHSRMLAAFVDRAIALEKAPLEPPKRGGASPRLNKI
jgi:coenzyme Q-binding protein COQ10